MLLHHYIFRANIGSCSRGIIIGSGTVWVVGGLIPIVTSGSTSGGKSRGELDPLKLTNILEVGTVSGCMLTHRSTLAEICS